MKSLKRTLSLVLALVMVLGLFGGLSINAAASDFTDDESIQYKEAVDVMTGIGAIDGYKENGTFSFKPKETITRAEAAKLVAYTVLGEDAAKRLPAGVTSRFSDVGDKFSWAAPSIEYLVNAGVINGMGDGTFHPNDPITGYEIGKMLLCAIGYGAKGEYKGNGWDLNVAIDGSVAKTGIFAGRADDANFLGDSATREEVALYCFNTIQAGMVEYFSSLDRYVGKTETLASNVPLTIMKTIYGDKAGDLTPSTAKTDDLGRPIKTWTYYAETIYSHPLTPILRYTTGTSEATLTKDARKAGYSIPSASSNDDILVYNGLKIKGKNLSNQPGFANFTGTKTAVEVTYETVSLLTGTGIVTEFYGDPTTREFTHIVMIATRLGAVTSVAEDGESMGISVTAAANGAQSSATVKKDVTDGYDNVYAVAPALIAAGQTTPPITVVVKQKITSNALGDETTGDIILNVGIPKTEEGKVSTVVKEDVTAVPGKVLTFVAGDKTYTVSSQAYNTGNVQSIIDVTNKPTVTVIMDENGYVLGVKEVDSEPPAVGMITAIGGTGSTYGAGDTKVKVLTAEGKETELVVSQLTNSSTVTKNPTPAQVKAAAPVKTAIMYTPATGSNEGKFEITVKAPSAGTAGVRGLTSATVTTGKSEITGTGGDALVTSDTTKYVYVTVKSDNIVSGTGGVNDGNFITYGTATYTGMKNAPTMTATSVDTVSAYVNNKGIAEVVYVVNGTPSGVTGLSFLAINDTEVIRDGAKEYYNAILLKNGSQENVKVLSSVFDGQFDQYLYGYIDGTANAAANNIYVGGASSAGLKADFSGLSKSALARACQAKNVADSSDITLSVSNDALILLSDSKTIGTSKDITNATIYADVTTNPVAFTDDAGNSLGTITLIKDGTWNWTSMAVTFDKANGSTKPDTGLDYKQSATTGKAASMAPVLLVSSITTDKDGFVSAIDAFTTQVGTTDASAGTITGTAFDGRIGLTVSSGSAKSYGYGDTCEVWEIDYNAGAKTVSAASKKSPTEIVANSGNRLAVWVYNTNNEVASAIYVIKLDSATAAGTPANANDGRDAWADIIETIYMS